MEEGQHVTRDSFDICCNTFPAQPPSKRQIEAAERESRATPEGASRRSLPPTPGAGGSTENVPYGADPVPNISSGYLQPTNRNTQMSSSMTTAESHVKPTQHPIEFNTEIQKGIKEERIYEYPRYAEIPTNKPLMDQNIGHYEPLGDPQVPHSYETIQKAPPYIYTSTPVPSPNNTAQSSLGALTSPVVKHPSERKVSNENLGVEGLTGAEVPDVHMPRNYQQSVSSGLLHYQPGGPRPLAHTGRVSPPIRARISDLEVALGFRSPEPLPPKSYPPAYPQQPAARNDSSQSFGDSFTGLKEPARIHFGSPLQTRLSNASNQSLGDLFTGLKENLHRHHVGTAQSTTPQTGTLTSNISNQSFGDSFTGLRQPITTQTNVTNPIENTSSNQSVGDRFTGLRPSNNRNTNATSLSLGDDASKVSTVRKDPPLLSPKPRAHRISFSPSIEEDLVVPTIDEVATDIVKKTMEDSLAKNIIDKTVKTITDQMQQTTTPDDAESNLMKKTSEDIVSEDKRAEDRKVLTEILKELESKVPRQDTTDKETTSTPEKKSKGPEDKANNEEQDVDEVDVDQTEPEHDSRDNSSLVIPVSDEGDVVDEVIDIASHIDIANVDSGENSSMVIPVSVGSDADVTGNVLDIASRVNIQSIAEDDEEPTQTFSKEDDDVEDKVINEVIDEIIETSSREASEETDRPACTTSDEEI